MPSSSHSLLIPCLLLLVLLARPTHAFGAGNIASTARIEGQNWRHGDIEDTLLTLLISRAAGGKKFSKMDVKRVYFGNWLRDYSQAVDVGTVSHVSAEAIRMLLWVLGFLSFGFGTKEFEVTTERLGCYRPEEHIDNPKDYADNVDARQYDRRLRGPVDERRELSVDPDTGLKNYIASERLGITTSAGLVRNLFGRSIELGRRYARSKDKADLFEALRLLGTGCHCLEDYSAHSNYTELSLIELGEHSVFPHVGRRTQISLQGSRQPVYPLVTGTFGGVDFLHSVMGELDDKATQSELQELEGTIQQSQGQGNSSIVQDLLNQLPSGLFGGKDEAGKADELQANAQAAQMANTHITPREPEAFTQQLNEIQKQIYPILEWHDELMQSINETIEKIPILPDLLEKFQDQLNIFVFSLMAPFVLPIINQVKTELATGSSEIIQSSKEKQLIVFHDDGSSDPTHSMLSKDHFSNILNEPAGKIASQVLKWAVPQVIQCWDDERIDVDRTLTRIVTGVFHHPAMVRYGNDGAAEGRQLMFGVVEQWWREKDRGEQDEFREKLSREGVMSGRNHKEGVHDKGHGCGKPLGMPTSKTSSSSGAIGGPAVGAVLGGLSQALGDDNQSSGYGGNTSGYGGKQSSGDGGIGKLAGEAVGGGALGGIVGGLVGGVGANLLGGAFGGDTDEKKTYHKEGYEQDGSYKQSVTQTGYHKQQYVGDETRYGQAEYSQTSLAGGGRREEYQRYEQGGGRSGYGRTDIRETRPTHQGGYEERLETRRERPGGAWESDVRTEGRNASGEFYSETHHHGSSYNQGRRDSDDDSDRKKREKKEKKHKKKKHHADDSEEESEEETRTSYNPRQTGYGEQERRGYQQQSSGYGGRTGYGEEPSGYGGHQERTGYGGREERTNYGGRTGYGEEPSGYGSHQERTGYGGREERTGYGGREETFSGYGGGNRYGGERQDYGRGAQGYGEQMPGGFGGGYEQERPAYGGGGGYGRQERGEGYGGRQEYGGREGYQQGQGYGGGRGYGEEEEREEGYGGGRGYGSGGREYQERRGYGDDY
ncbi:MAG: hypothetical protein M1836_005218 [Candelina mexicana]|nr:MAG: hypothetical protein M1836_005218 [Candelina mexicana]